MWFDKWEILPGDSLIQKIGDAILENDYFIVVLSPDSVGSEWVTRELSLALNREFEQRKVSVIPLLYKDCAHLAFLKDKAYADFRTSYQSGLEHLVKSIARDKAKQSVGSTLPLDQSYSVVWDNVYESNIVSNNVRLDNVGQDR